MRPTITAFERSPDRGRGLARDMRVRWALEELGLDYDVRLVSFADMKAPEHRARNPFGQIPTYDDGELALFESGAIVLHLAQTHAGLLPSDSGARMRAVMWMFAALNTVEPPVVERSLAFVLERDKPWYQERLVMIEKRMSGRLGELSAALGDGKWLDGDFSAADLLMVTVLQRAESSQLLEAFPNLVTYLERGRARPAFQRAFAAQLEVFQQGEAAGSPA